MGWVAPNLCAKVCCFDRLREYARRNFAARGMRVACVGGESSCAAIAFRFRACLFYYAWNDFTAIFLPKKYATSSFILTNLPSHHGALSCSHVLHPLPRSASSPVAPTCDVTQSRVSRVRWASLCAFLCLRARSGCLLKHPPAWSASVGVNTDVHGSFPPYV